jgi:hypothetical protein
VTEAQRHDVHATHRYTVHFPEHGPRTDDPHYIDFDHYHRTHKATAKCYIGERKGFDECDLNAPLELHHAHIEFALTNGVNFAALEKDYPGISDPTRVGAWVESEQNFRWLCAYHHRSTEAGAHAISHSDWEANQYVLGFTEARPANPPPAA